MAQDTDLPSMSSSLNNYFSEQDEFDKEYERYACGTSSRQETPEVEGESSIEEVPREAAQLLPQEQKAYEAPIVVAFQSLSVQPSTIPSPSMQSTPIQSLPIQSPPIQSPTTQQPVYASPPAQPVQHQPRIVVAVQQPTYTVSPIHYQPRTLQPIPYGQTMVQPMQYRPHVAQPIHYPSKSMPSMQYQPIPSSLPRYTPTYPSATQTRSAFTNPHNNAWNDYQLMQYLRVQQSMWNQQQWNYWSQLMAKKQAENEAQMMKMLMNSMQQMYNPTGGGGIFGGTNVMGGGYPFGSVADPYNMMMGGGMDPSSMMSMGGGMDPSSMMNMGGGMDPTSMMMGGMGGMDPNGLMGMFSGGNGCSVM